MGTMGSLKGKLLQKHAKVFLERKETWRNRENSV
jgi:hypothetical protein